MKSLRSNFILGPLLVLLMVASCQKNIKTVKADLSFRSIIFTSAYGADTKDYDKIIKKIDSSVNNYNSNENSNFNTYQLNKHILKLHSLGLLKLPHAYLHFGSDSIMEVHISEKEYKKIEDFKQIDLRKENKKILIELDVEEIDSGIYFSDNIRNVIKVDGRSRSNIFKKQ